jgi:hypothetical protein
MSLHQAASQVLRAYQVVGVPIVKWESLRNRQFLDQGSYGRCYHALLRGGSGGDDGTSDLEEQPQAVIVKLISQVWLRAFEGERAVVSSGSTVHLDMVKFWRLETVCLVLSCKGFFRVSSCYGTAQP